MNKKRLLMGICVTAIAVSFSSGIAIANADGAEQEQTAPVLTMQEGASIRYMDPVGIRFVTDVATDKYEEIIGVDSEAVFGTLIIPKEVLGDKVITADNYLTIDAENIVAKTWLADTETTKSFACALGGTKNEDGTYSDFPVEYYNVDLYAVSYCSYTTGEGTTVIFAENPQTYSVAYIASALQAKGETDPILSEITDRVLGETLAFASETYTLYKGDTLETVLNAKGLKATYSTDNESVATVDQNGVVTGVGAGTVQITAKIGNKTATVNVTVETPIALNGTYDFSLENETSATSIELEGNVTKITTGSVEVTEGVSYADGQLTLTKTALQSLLGGKAYAEGLAVEIHTDAGKRYTAEINVATMFIDSAEDLTAITNANKDTKIVDAYYIVTADIDASTAGITVSGTAGAQKWTADNVVRFVGGDYSMTEAGFAGIFDGRGHVISNLNTFAYKWQGTGGLFGQLNSGSQVKNVAFTDVVINGRFGAMLVGETCGFNGLMENVVITLKGENIVPYGTQEKDYTKILWKLSGGEIKNCLFVGVEQIAFDTEGTTVANVMSVTTSENENVKNNGGFNASGTKYSAHPNYASVNAMLSALNSENKLQNWGDITYNNGAVYYGETVVVLPELIVESSINGNEISRGASVTFTTDGYSALSLKEEVVGVTLENGVLTIGEAEEGAQIVVVATSTLNANVTKELFTYTVIRNYTEIALTGTYDLSLENETSSITPSQVIEGSIEKVKTANTDVTESVTFADGKLTFTKTALQSLLGGKAYADGLAIEIYTSADNKYTATVNIVTKIISSYEDLESIRTTGETLDGYFVLGQSFVAGNETAMTKLIGTWSSDSAKGFVGIFDGRGYSITGLKLTNQGLFRCMGQSIVRNLALIDVYVEGVDTDTATAPQYTYSVFGDADCKSTTFENLFISTNAKGMIHNVYGNVTIKNVVFVSSYQGSGYLSNSGSGGSYNIENAIVVGKGDARYFGGTLTKNNTAVYDTAEKMLEALAAENAFEQWNSSFSYQDNAIYFGETAVVVQTTVE